MDDIRNLYYVLVLIYLIECVVRFKSTGLIFASRLGWRWFYRTGGALFNAKSTALFAGNPLPPFGGLTVVPELQFAVSPDGLINRVYHTINRRRQPPTLPPIHLTYDEIHCCEVRGSTLRLNGRDFLSMDSETDARNAQNQITILKSAAPGEREALIRRNIQATLDFKAAAIRRILFQSFARYLRILAVLLFTLLFLAIPAAFVFRELGRAWPYLVAAHFALLIPLLFNFRAGHLQLFPGRRFERWQQIVAMLFSPPLGIRSVDLLGRDVFAGLHPLTIARLLLVPDQFRTLAEFTLRDLHTPTLPERELQSLPIEARAIESWFRSRILLPQIEMFLADSGYSRETLLAAPDAGNDSDSRSYCPRCRAEYTINNGECAECQVPLRTRLT